MAFTDFKKLVDSRFKFGLFMLAKLPSAFFCGVQVRSIHEEQAIVSVPFKWLSQNPFKSIYFACQAMAAEMSTGVLAIGHSYQSDPSVSMLLTRMDAVFVKRAQSRIQFTCNDGLAIQQAIGRAIETGESQTVSATSIGRDVHGQEISRFQVQWSFKARGQ